MGREYGKSDDTAEPLERWMLVTLLLALLVGVHLRVERLSAVPLFGDEYHSLNVIDQPLEELLRSFDQWGTHIALPALQRMSHEALGPGVMGLRLPVVIAGILSLLLCFLVASRLVGRLPALLATVALALNPMHVFYSRFGRSYVPALLLGLALVQAVSRATRGVDRPDHIAWVYWMLVMVVAALLPYVHLTSLAFVGALALTSLALSWQAERRLADLLPPMVTFGLAGILTWLLYLPAMDAVREYLSGIETLASPGPVHAMDVATLLAGGRWVGFLWLAVVPLAAVWALRARTRSALWLLAGISGPLIGLLLSTPYGMAYAYARYLLVSLPFLLMLLAWLFVHLLQLLAPRDARATQIAGVLGIALLIVIHLMGPYGPSNRDDHPFSNSYLALRQLPAFDLPDPETPAFYRTLAENDAVDCIIEAPLLVSRAVLLYRNYQLQHGKRTLVGLAADVRGALGGLPYVSIRDHASLRECGADFLVLHLAVDTELARYWRFVYDEALPSVRSPGDDGFMLRHEEYTSQPFRRLHNLVPPLTEQLGEPIYRDALIVAWRL
jgi:hypothetical protein